MKNSMLALTTALLLATVAVAHQAHENHDAPGTILVDSVMAGTAAEAAGVRDGDFILRIDGRKTVTMDDLQAIMGEHRPGDTVSLTVHRDGEEIDLPLKFGERPDGGVSIGVQLNIYVTPGAEPTEGTTQCLAWIEKTYRIESMMGEMGLDPAEDYEALLACVQHDTQRMESASAIKYCDNVFKVHCSGLELLNEIGEAQVERCEKALNESLGLTPKQYKGWNTCAEHEVFDRYAHSGEPSNTDACKAALLEECGTNIDSAIATGETSSEQKGFIHCCSADELVAKSGSESACSMIDDGFSRGPCHDQPVCINRHTSEWMNCSVLE